MPKMPDTKWQSATPEEIAHTNAVREAKAANVVRISLNLLPKAFRAFLTLPLALGEHPRE